MSLIRVDRAIKEVWINNIRMDYFNNFLLMEDSLKNSFYYHLRTRLSDQFLIKNNLRIYTELNTGYGERIDIAVVQVDDNIQGHLWEKIVDCLAVIELKHKGKQVSVDPFYLDIAKIKTYLKRKDYMNCQYYLGFIHETEYSLEETSWLNKRQQETWAKGSLTELSGFYNDDHPVFTVVSHNDMNHDLNRLRV